jgi:hypothetical protein
MRSPQLTPAPAPADDGQQAVLGMLQATNPAMADAVSDMLALQGMFDQAIELQDTVRSAASKPGFGDDMGWLWFARMNRMMNPQQYGAKLQNRLADHYGWTVISNKIGRGDIIDRGRYYEMKVSLITASNMTANFLHIRPHQDLSGYHCFVIDPDYFVHHFWLTKSQMRVEVEKYGTVTHGTRAAVAENKTKEWTIRFTWDPNNQLYQRWMSRFLYDSFIPA